MTGVGALPLSQATERVSQAASMVKAEAINVLKVVEEVEAAAVRAGAAVSATQAAKAAAAEIGGGEGGGRSSRGGACSSSSLRSERVSSRQSWEV